MRKTLVTLTILGSVFAAGFNSASAETLVAGWDNFTGSTDWVPSYKVADITVTAESTTEHNAWSNWNNNDLGASNDGTFGNLITSVASADTAYTGGGKNLSLNQSNGTITFTLTNNSGSSKTLEAFYFDSIHRFSAASAWELSFGGAISGTAVGGSISEQYDMHLASSANRDKDVDLTGLIDNIWEAGSQATFTLAFSGATNSGSGGGVELVVDNIGITIVPEPSSAVLLGLVGAALCFIRRRSR